MHAAARTLVPWDTALVSLGDTGKTIELARIWVDVLASDDADREHFIDTATAILERKPHLARWAATIAREPGINRLPATQQLAWLVSQLDALDIPHDTPTEASGPQTPKRPTARRDAR